MIGARAVKPPFQNRTIKALKCFQKCLDKHCDKTSKKIEKIIPTNVVFKMLGTNLYTSKTMDVVSQNRVTYQYPI